MSEKITQKHIADARALVTADTRAGVFVATVYKLCEQYDEELAEDAWHQFINAAAFGFFFDSVGPEPDTQVTGLAAKSIATAFDSLMALRRQNEKPCDN